MQELKKSLKKNTLYVLLSNPSAYLKVLIIRTLLIGISTLVINLVLGYFKIEASLPSTMHSLIGIVIGLLLVFRTNTAYDRWWDGRKLISNVSQEIDFMSARLLVMENHQTTEIIMGVRTELNRFLDNLRNYLKDKDEENHNSLDFHIHQKHSIQNIMILLKKIGDTPDTLALHASLGKLLEYSNSLERIKNTPIPLSYVLHIKISIFIYMITLPFGLFHDLGLWATPMVMLVYYIIAGVEIISNEIENPFADDPNDLPTDTLFDVIVGTLWDVTYKKQDGKA